jgi:glyoxylase-like metal-dependent hydrolase (beta-lactamase superfamily II)
MQVTEHIHALRVNYQIRVSPTMLVKRFVYVYFIVGEKVHLIDAGVASRVDAIEAYLATIGRSMDEIATVALTHAHPDHMGGLKTIQLRSGCRVLVHAAEQSWVEHTRLQAVERPVPEFEHLVAGDVKVDQLVAHGDCIDLEPGLELSVIHTAGHSEGSVCYLLKGDETLFTGDAMAFAWGVPIYDDVMVSAASVKRLQSIEDIACLLSSWDEPRYGEDVSRVLRDCLSYLQTVHEAVRAEVIDPDTVDPTALCKGVFAQLKLPAVAANARVAQSLMSHVPHLGLSDITGSC